MALGENAGEISEIAFPLVSGCPEGWFCSCGWMTICPMGISVRRDRSVGDSFSSFKIRFFGFFFFFLVFQLLLLPFFLFFSFFFSFFFFLLNYLLALNYLFNSLSTRLPFKR